MQLGDIKSSKAICLKPAIITHTDKKYIQLSKEAKLQSRSQTNYTPI